MCHDGTRSGIHEESSGTFSSCFIFTLTFYKDKYEAELEKNKIEFDELIEFIQCHSENQRQVYLEKEAKTGIKYEYNTKTMISLVEPWLLKKMREAENMLIEKKRIIRLLETALALKSTVNKSLIDCHEMLVGVFLP